jgi:VIT1/CCC1 family predicted Fe2+/Mn2+ transporter
MQRRGFLRNFIFGAEDGLVSTVGLLSGVSFAGLASREIIVSGIILILVEALSMGAGVYISEDSTNELADGQKKENQLNDSLVMFFSYMMVGLIPLMPYIFIPDTRQAFYYSVASTIIALIGLGVFKGYYVKKSLFLSALKVTTIGTIVVLLAIAVGTIV